MSKGQITSLADDALVGMATSGRADALSELLKRRGPQVRRELSISRKWQSALDPDDVMQVTYVEAFLRIEQFKPRGPDSFLAWLRQIAQNNLRDAIKAMEREKRPPPDKRVQPPSGEDSFVALYELLGATSTTPSRVVAGQEAQALLESALEELPPDYATVVRLHDLEGRTGPEVAAAMGRSRGAIFMLLARAHDQLRQNLGSASKFFSHGA